MSEARIGRPPLGVEFVRQLDGSPLAKARLSVILKTLTKELSITEACQELGIGPSRFHAIREAFLQQSLELLEPKPAGRPPAMAPSPPADLVDQLTTAQRDLQLAEVRLELAEILQASPAPEAEQKKTGAIARMAHDQLRQRRMRHKRRLKRLGRPR